MWRTFDVSAVSQLPPFVGADVAAGRGGTSRTVTRARAAATPEELRRAEADELVVTTTETLGAAGADAEELVAGLAGAGVAGLAVRHGPSDALSHALLRAADAWSVPVIAFPDGAELTEVTAAILEALLEAQRQRLDRFLDTHQRFTRIMMAGGGTSEIALTLHELLNCPVAVVGNDGRPTVIVPSEATATVDIEGGIRQPIGPSDNTYGEVAPSRPRQHWSRTTWSPSNGRRLRSPCISPKRPRWPTLHVHYNTLKNRMERIEAIIGPVVTDAAHALECAVAIYVERHYDVPWKLAP